VGTSISYAILDGLVSAGVFGVLQWSRTIGGMIMTTSRGFGLFKEGAVIAIVAALTYGLKRLF